MNKFIVLFGLLFVSLPDHVFSQFTLVLIEISNPITVNRKEEVVAIRWDDILTKYPAIDTANFKIVNILTKKEVPWQLEFKGENNIQNLLIQLDIAANSTIKLGIQKGKSTAITSKTYGRYVPERKDDFAWENDKIAHRMYGKGLEQNPKEMAYGMDVWVKRTDKLILNERYERGEYHIDHGDGMDYYHVGYTLGSGDIAPYVHDSVYYSKNYRRWKILDNGPLRTTFILDYDDWNVDGMKVRVAKRISIDAGSQLSRVEAQFSTTEKSALPVVIGIAKREEPGVMLLDEQQGLMAYWEPQFGADGITGVGSVLMTPAIKIKTTNGQILMQTIAKNDNPIIYYTGAAWNKANEITSSKSWFDYIQSFRTRLLNPVRVVLE